MSLGKFWGWPSIINHYLKTSQLVSSGYGKQDNSSSGQWPNVTRESGFHLSFYPPLGGQTWNRAQSVWCLSSNSVSSARHPAHPLIVYANNSTWFGFRTLTPSTWPPYVLVAWELDYSQARWFSFKHCPPHLPLHWGCYSNLGGNLIRKAIHYGCWCIKCHN